MKKEICKNCTFYCAYYVQFSSNYTRRNQGYCKNKNCPIKERETCENFKSNERLEKMRSKRLLTNLERASVAIDEMAQIIKEKCAEEKRAHKEKNG